MMNKFKRTKKDIRAKFIPFNELFYTHLQPFDDDFISQACVELGLKESFTYANAYVKDRDEVQVFLCAHSLLDESEFISTEALCFAGLKDKYSQNFGVLFLEKNYSFICFYENDSLKFCKNIPKYNENYLKDKSKSELLAFLNDENLSLKALLEKFSCEQFFIYSSNDLLIEMFQNELFKNAQKLAQDDLKLMLAKASQETQSSINFNRNLKKNSNSLLKALCACFVLSFALFSAYPLYTFLSFHFKESKALEIEPLSQNELKDLEQKEAQIAELKEHLRPSFMLLNIRNFTQMLNASNAKVLSLEFSNYQIKLSAFESVEFENFIQKLYENKDFIIKDKSQENDIYTLILELKNDR